MEQSTQLQVPIAIVMRQQAIEDDIFIPRNLLSMSSIFSEDSNCMLICENHSVNLPS